LLRTPPNSSQLSEQVRHFVPYGQATLGARLSFIICKPAPFSCRGFARSGEWPWRARRQQARATKARGNCAKVAGGKRLRGGHSQTICAPANPTDPGDAADPSTPQGIEFTPNTHHATHGGGRGFVYRCLYCPPSAARI